MENNIQTKQSKLKLILLVFFLLILISIGAFLIFRFQELNKVKETQEKPTVPKKSEAAPSGTKLENNKLWVEVVDTGPGNYESHTGFKPGGQTDSKPVTNNVLEQKYKIRNKTSEELKLRLLVFPYKMYTVGAFSNKCVDLYTNEQINEFVKTQGNGNPEQAYKKFADIFYEGMLWEEVKDFSLPERISLSDITAGTNFGIEGSTSWQSIWTKNGKNFKRKGEIVSEKEVRWNNWFETNTSSYPGEGEVTSESIFVTQDYIERSGNYIKIYEEIFRGNKLYRRKIEVSGRNASSQEIWSGNSGSWEEIDIRNYPGSGSFQATTNYVTTYGNNEQLLIQSIWRDKKGYSRQIDVDKRGNPGWDNDVTWKGPYEESILPGQGNFEVQMGGYIKENILYSSIIRGGKMYERKSIVQNNGRILWNANHCYDNPAVPPFDPSQGQLRLNTQAGAGSLTCEYYKSQNIKTCTDSQTLVSYGNNPPYFLSPETLNLGPGEEKEITFTITNNICGFYQWDHGILINNKETFWTGSEIKFFTCQNVDSMCIPLRFNLTTTTPTTTPTPTPRITLTPTPTNPPNEETPTPTPAAPATKTTLTPTPTTPPGALAQTNTPTPRITSTPSESLPDAGTPTPTLFGLGIGILLLLTSLLLAL